MDVVRQNLEKKILEYVEKAEVQSLKEKKVRQGLNLSEDENEIWAETLETMLSDGFLIRTKTSLLGVPKQMNLVVGTYASTSKGFGFVIPDGVKGDDIFISPALVGGSMNGDRVVCRLNRSRGGRGRDGEVIRILKRAHENVVGTFESAGAYGFVVPDHRKLGSDIFVPHKGIGFATHGDKVIVEITQYPEKGRGAQGVIIDVLGKANDPTVVMESVIFQYGIHQNFPAAVLEAAAEIPDEVPESAKKGRKDLRHLRLITIDGEDARDLDDAVYVERRDNGEYFLGVYIADVSYYVRTGSVIDKESYDRGTSVYFPDRVIPMLPAELSNGICSLNAGVDRLAFCCEMIIDAKGKVTESKIFDAVIRVDKRLSYTQVKKALVDKDLLVRDELIDQIDMLEEMGELCDILRKRRFRRGAIDFDFPEIKVKVDEKGRTIDLVKLNRSLAESIIEEFMLAANETVAQFMADKKLPFVYRVHETPDSEKIQNFGELLGTFGYQLPRKKELEPSDLQEVLEKFKGKPEERLLSTVMLRSLKQAIYSEENLGHFGLAAKYYTHFTSPIRRYPDLMVHRLLKSEIGVKEGNASNKEQKLDYLAKATKHASEQERNATLAEREAVDLKKVEFMSAFIGDEFTGIISGVTAFGFFVELDNGAEGLVRISYLQDDYYQYFENQWKLVGQRTGRTFRLGDMVKVRLVKASPEERQIDFILAGENYEVDLEAIQKQEFAPKRDERKQRPLNTKTRSGEKNKGEGFSANSSSRNKKKSSTSTRKLKNAVGKKTKK